MKHRISQRKLGRPIEHRLAMLKTMVTQLIRYERLETTLAKAKELRRMADRVITYGKEGSEQSRKLASQVVREDDALFKLFTEMAHRYQFRQGGYTRVIRSRVRRQDAAQLAYIEFIDRVGELRPARPPLKTFLPVSAEVLAKSSQDVKAEETKKSEPESKPSRFFGLF